MSEATGILLAAILVGLAVLARMMRRPRKARRFLNGYAIVDEPGSKLNPYPYVYVSADGSASELHPDQRKYLETRYHPADGARPYVKSSYSQTNGWGEVAGFLERSRLPDEIVVQAAPAENPSKPMTKADQLQFLRSKGMVVTENPDGTATVRKPEAK